MRRCIYGLKQASRRFFEKLRGILISAGYRPTKSDPCLYRRVSKGKETLVSVVVDDLLIAADDKRDSDRIIRKLRDAGLKTKDLGTPKYVIGMHVSKKRNGDITINQKLHIETLLRRFGMQDAHGCKTPADPNVKLSKKLEAQNDKEKEDMKQKMISNPR